MFARARRLYRAIPESGLLLVIVALGAFLTFASGSILIRGETVNTFLRIDNILPNVLTPVSWMAIMAVGVTFVIIAGGIDISVGSIFGCAALGTAAVLQNLPPGASGWIVLPCALAVAVAIGAGAGFLNGGLTVGLRLHPFIVTLGTLSILRGIALIAVEAKSLPAMGKSLPAAFTSGFVGYEIPFGPLAWAKLQPVPMLVMIACVLAAAVYLRKTAGGREVYAVGGNEEAAFLSGLRVGVIKMRVYVLSGIAAGIAGMLSAGYYGSANTATGEGYELTVIAAAVVGGASLSGGKGSAAGAMLGAFIIKLIENGIDIVKRIDLGFLAIPVTKEYSKIIIGAAIILAVALDRLSRRSR